MNLYLYCLSHWDFFYPVHCSIIDLSLYLWKKFEWIDFIGGETEFQCGEGGPAAEASQKSKFSFWQACEISTAPFSSLILQKSHILFKFKVLIWRKKQHFTITTHSSLHFYFFKFKLFDYQGWKEWQSLPIRHLIFSDEKTKAQRRSPTAALLKNQN